MSVAMMIELVSQAEKEGTTVAEIIARQLTVEQMDKAQAALEEQLAENYRRIEKFMCDVCVPSIDEVMAMSEDERSHLIAEAELAV
jgi:hypothetical protein